MTLVKEYKIWKQYCEETSLSSDYVTQSEETIEKMGGRKKLRKGNKKKKRKNDFIR